MARAGWLHALGSVGRTLLRALRFSGPLLADALALLWRLAREAGGELRMLLLRFRARGAAERLVAVQEERSRHREMRAERWTAWRGTPVDRRIQVSLAAFLLVAITAAAVSFRVRPDGSEPHGREQEDAVAPESVDASASVPEPQRATAPPADARPPVERFEELRRNAAPGAWVVAPEPIVDRGERGAWDDFRVGSPVVMTGEAADARFRMWYVGCRLAGVIYDCGIGHATSRDGLRWQKRAAPVFVPPDLPRPHWISAISIARAGDRLVMLYGIDADPVSEREATLRRAESSDGLAWSDGGNVSIPIDPALTGVRPAVCFDGRTLHLWYADTSESGEGRALEHLTSNDGQTWTSAGEQPQPPGPSERAWITCGPGSTFRAWIFQQAAGPALALLTSTDGTRWTAEGRRLPARLDGELLLVDASGVEDRDGLTLWTTMVQQERPAAERIGIAFRKAAGSR